jgi:hypothetical protein
MRLKLEELKKIVDQTLVEERSVATLREEITRVLGPSVATNVKLDQLAEGANYRLDVLERTGRRVDASFNPTVLLKFANSKSVEARKLAARMLPENIACRFKNDVSAAVRNAYAKRTSLKNALRMLKENPHDDELRYVVKQKRLNESGLPDPVVVKEPFDMYGEKLGNTVKQQHHKGSELSDLWYSTMASKFIQDYGTNLEGNWEEILAKRYCSSARATSLVEVDEKKLYDEIMKQIRDREDLVKENYSLSESLNLSELYETSEPEITEDELDEVEDLLETNYSTSEFVRKAKKVFSIVEMTAPISLRKYRVSEGKRDNHFSVPCKGRLPRGKRMSSMIEEALDKYVSCWNDIQSSRGEPVKIDWAPNPVLDGTITFKAELKL